MWRTLLTAALVLGLSSGCSSRAEKICKKMALLMGASGAEKTKIARCIKRVDSARKAMPKRFECRARCIEASIDRKSFDACNDKCDPAAAARRAAIRDMRRVAANAGKAKGSANKAEVVVVPRELRRTWFTECMAKCQHHLVKSGSQAERIEGTKKAGVCSGQCLKEKLKSYKK